MNDPKRLRNVANAIREVAVRLPEDGTVERAHVWTCRVGELLTEGCSYSALLRERFERVTRGIQEDNPNCQLSAVAIVFARSCGVQCSTLHVDHQANCVRTIADLLDEYADAEAEDIAAERPPIEDGNAPGQTSRRRPKGEAARIVAEYLRKQQRDDITLNEISRMTSLAKSTILGTNNWQDYAARQKQARCERERIMQENAGLAEYQDEG